MSEPGEADVPFDGRASAVLVAAGSSVRMRATGNAPAERKPFLEVGGRTLLELSCAAFDACPIIEELVLVVHPGDVERVRRLAAERRAFAKVRAVVPGGDERADSVRIGVRACTAATDVVAVHDAARPLLAARG
jgi:2-C-methyl-D-erythritol 4-phosphate cytidylyltransferase